MLLKVIIKTSTCLSHYSSLDSRVIFLTAIIDWSALGVKNRDCRQLCQSSIDYAAAILVLLNSIVLMMEPLHWKTSPPKKWEKWSHGWWCWSVKIWWTCILIDPGSMKIDPGSILGLHISEWMGDDAEWEKSWFQYQKWLGTLFFSIVYCRYNNL